jgi:photosystem II stability/assembly factor-like uncharacterized protein
MISKQKGKWRPGSAPAENWEEMGPVAAGGSVFDLAVLAAPRFIHVWAATSCGVFRHRGKGVWAQHLNGLTTPLISSLHACPGGMLLAGGMNGELFRSLDGGNSFERATQLHAADLAPVTCLASSHSFDRDGTALAGTEGGGVWRTEDGGRRWLPANFGLVDQSVQVLLCSTDWSRQEVALAGTAEGLFRSTNGGRAWREVDWPFSDMAISALAAAPEQAENEVFFAGSEEGYVYCSTDGGHGWNRLSPPSQGSPINALYVVPGTGGQVLLAGTTEGIFLSDDGGSGWKLVCAELGAVLSLTGTQQMVVGGSYDSGVWQSEDGGRTWQTVSQGLAARGLAKIVAAQDGFYVLGPNEGLWRSRDGGQSWNKLESLGPHLPLSTFAVARSGDGEVLLVSSVMSGLLRSTDGGASWQVVQEGSDVLTFLVAAAGPVDRRAWAATATGEVLFSANLGATWSTLSTDTEGERALLLAASPHVASDGTLFLGTATEVGWRKQPTVHIWRSTDEGRTWRKILDQHTSATWLDAVLPPAPGRKPYDGAYFATETQCLRPLQGGHDVWVGTQMTADAPNVLALAMDGDPNDGGALYSATSSGIFRSRDGGRTWEMINGEANPGSYVSVAIGPGDDGRRDLYALELGGRLWRLPLS